MLEKKFKITSSQGLHARPATQLVRMANDYDCEIGCRIMWYPDIRRVVIFVWVCGEYICDDTDCRHIFQI